VHVWHSQPRLRKIVLTGHESSHCLGRSVITRIVSHQSTPRALYSANRMYQLFRTLVNDIDNLFVSSFKDQLPLTGNTKVRFGKFRVQLKQYLRGLPKQLADDLLAQVAGNLSPGASGLVSYWLLVASLPQGRIQPQNTAKSPSQKENTAKSASTQPGISPPPDSPRSGKFRFRTRFWRRATCKSTQHSLEESPPDLQDGGAGVFTKSRIADLTENSPSSISVASSKVSDNTTGSLPCDNCRLFTHPSGLQAECIVTKPQVQMVILQSVAQLESCQKSIVVELPSVAEPLRVTTFNQNGCLFVFPARPVADFTNEDDDHKLYLPLLSRIKTFAALQNFLFSKCSGSNSKSQSIS